MFIRCQKTTDTDEDADTDADGLTSLRLPD